MQPANAQIVETPWLAIKQSHRAWNNLKQHIIWGRALNSLEALLVWYEVVEEPRLICNRDGEVVWINSAARTYAERELYPNKHTATWRGVWQATLAAGLFTQILEGASKAQPNGTIKIQFDTPASKLTEVRILPFSSELNDLIGITIPPGQPFNQGSCQELKATFGLTKTECRILGDVLDGKSPSDTAEDSGTSIFTVRTHIRNIYRKLNVNNRGSLLRRIKRYT